MSVVLGSGEHRYRVVENWAKLPDGWDLRDVAAVAVDSKDRVYVFNRGDHPMVVLNRDGYFVKSWGEGLFRRAHGLHIDADDNLYCTDDGDHTVRKCSTDGKVLLTIGIPGKPAPYMSGEPFHRCTHTALSPKGEIYVSDGYGNACVHKYTPDGKLLKTWGEPGSDPGQFNIVHNIVDRRGRLGLRGRPREPSRAGVRRQRQIRDAVEQSAPALRAVLLRRQEAELHHRRARPRHAGQSQSPNLGPRLTDRRRQGKRIARLGGENGPGLETGKFLAPHGLALNSKGDIYVGEVGVTNWKTSFPGHADAEDRALSAEAGAGERVARMKRSGWACPSREAQSGLLPQVLDYVRGPRRWRVHAASIQATLTRNATRSGSRRSARAPGRRSRA